MFYSGAKLVTTGMAYRTFDWGQATRAVDRMLASMPRAPNAAAPAGRIAAARG
jgi:hypothetical protein